MPEPDIQLLPPPPLPPVITLSDDDNKEDGELSDQEETSRGKKSKKHNRDVPQSPTNESDIEIRGDDIYKIDDDGDGLNETLNIEDDEVFKKMRAEAGIDDGHDITLNIAETPKVTRSSGTCFNCGGPHLMSECTLKRDHRRIARNRQSFGSAKKDRITEHTESKFKPGKLSDAVYEALNLHEDQYPQWIYRMREAGPMKGYPPAYLKRLKPEEKRLVFLCDDPQLNSDVPVKEVEFDSTKIVYYDGFNLVDRSSPAEIRCNQNVRRDSRWPAYSQESYARELEKYLKDPSNNPNRKRHHDSDSHDQQRNKRARYDAYANETPQGRPASERPNKHIIFDDKDDNESPRSPDLPPVISRALTEDQATPKGFLVPVVDDRKMPDTDNFAKNITPFQYDNLAKRTDRMDKMEELLKKAKKES